MSGVHTGSQDFDIDLARLFSSISRNFGKIVFISLIVTVLAFLAATFVGPRYSAETRVLIETRESVFTRSEENRADDRPILDEEGVLSQVEVMMSTDLLKSVARELNLASRSEFDSAANMSAFERGLVMLGLLNDPVAIAPEERVLKEFRDKLSIYRVDRSRVIVIEFWSKDQKLAADVPNAIAEAYIAIQRDAKLASNVDATAWLEPEIEDLRRRVKEAESRVANYRASSDLLIGRGENVLATQQLSDLSTELSRVRASRASAEATAKSVSAALQRGASLDTLPNILDSDLIQRLRERQVRLRAEIAELSTTLLDGHPRIKSLKSQLADFDEQIRLEAQKVLEGLKTDAETARIREQQLERSLNELKAESARAGSEEVELRALEREATAQRELLESYLTRYREAASRKQYNYLPVDARIFSRAIVPTEPYFPKKLPIVISAFLGAMLIMILFTLVRELFSGRAMVAVPNGYRQPIADVEMPVASMVTHSPSIAPEKLEPANLEIADEMSIGNVAEKVIASGVARAIIVSPEGDEAAASSVMLAREIADTGLRVLLLDLTASGAASSPLLEGQALPGITDLLSGEAQFADVIHVDHYSECHVIPVGTASPARAMRAVERLPIILNSLTTAYDIVVVECGATDAAGLHRLVSDGTEILVSVIDTTSADNIESIADLARGGYEDVMLVSPAVSDVSAKNRDRTAA